MDASCCPLLKWILLPPLAGFVLNGLGGKRWLGEKAGGGLASAAVLASFAFALAAFSGLLALPPEARLLREHLFGWISAGTFTADAALRFDPLSAVMALVVSGVSFLIHVYSMGYMKGDAGYNRYFCYLNLFVFFMLTLVLADNPLLMFVGWEGVGLCSYLLIGFWYEDPEKAAAGKKAFIVNRVGDAGFLLGLMLLSAVLAGAGVYSMDFDTLERSVPLLSSATVGGGAALTLICLLLFFGATGKSAQFPLYVWLPDAMAGPTPVSALIHAATMVTAGVYMLARLHFLYELAPRALEVVLLTGCFTAFFAAVIALLQKDIKKVLAYSTVSQLGYMFLGLGASGFAAGFFHVFTHAWFKALLFLGAGSVIHAMHHEQDLFRMGGLRSKLPVTFWTMLIATLAIMGLPPFSGFFSKDEILYLAFLKSPWLWGIGVVGACCTAFYMWRLMALAFWGEPRDHHAFDHAHESPWQMTAPLAVLAVGSALAGFLGVPEAFGGHFAIGRFLEPALTFGQAHAGHGGHHAGPAVLLAVISTGLGLAAAATGFLLYKDGLGKAEAMAARVPGLHLVLLNKYFVDEAIEGYLLRPIRWFGNLLWKLFDVILIDGVGVNLPGALTRVAGDFVALLQTGRVRNYALGMGVGLLALLWAFLK